jgi:hypothetical protein
MAMSSHSSRRSRRKKKKDELFVEKPRNSTTLPIFLLTLGFLLAATAIWSVTRDRSLPIPIDPSDGGAKSISAIQGAKSWRRLEAAADEIKQRISGQQPSEVRDLLIIYQAIAERQLELATENTQKTSAQLKQLTALRGLAVTAQSPGVQLKLATELSALGLSLKDQPDKELASQAFQSLFLASELILTDGLNDENDSSRLATLLPTWVAQAAQQFPADQAICATIGNLFSRYPAVEDRNQQLQQIATAVQSGYRKSPNPAIVEWAGRLEIRHFFDQNKVLDLLTSTLTQTELQSEPLRELEDQLLADTPTPIKVQFAVELAQIYEGFDDVQAMQRLLDRVSAQDFSQWSKEKREQLQSDLLKMKERQSLRGQKLGLEFKLRDGTRFTPQQAEEAVSLLVFFKSPEELEKLEYQLRLLQRLPRAKFRYFLIGPEIEEAQWARLSSLIKPNDDDFRLPLLQPSSSEELTEKFRVTNADFFIILDQDRVQSLGVPLNRARVWLENRLYGK